MNGAAKREAHDNSLFLGVALLVCIGLVTVYSASYAYASVHGQNPETTLLRQLAAVVVGFAALAICTALPTRVVRGAAWPLMLLSVALLVAVLVWGTGPQAGIHRWLLGPAGISVQPSVISVVILAIVVSALGAWYGEDARRYPAFALGSFVAIGLTCGLIVVEPNLSMMLLAGATGIAVALAGGLRVRDLAIFIAAWLGTGGAVAWSVPYMQKRVQEFLTHTGGGDPGYQVHHALIALGSGGWGGVGLCCGVEKFGYLPEVQNDMIFAAIGEELGLVMTVLMVALYGWILLRGIRVAILSESLFGRYLAAGITASVTLQACVNILVVTGSAPATGVPLPFVSAGGSSIAVLLGAMGLVLSVSRESVPERLEAGWGHAHHAVKRGNGRTRIPSVGRGRVTI